MLAYVAACSIAIVVLHFVMVVRWVRLFAADYMVSFWFVAGIALVALTRIHESGLLFGSGSLSGLQRPHM